MNIEYLWIDELFYYKQYKLSQCWNIWIEGKKNNKFQLQYGRRLRIRQKCGPNVSSYNYYDDCFKWRQLNQWKKYSSLSKTIVTLSVPTIISDVVSIGSDPKLDDWIQLNYEHTVFCSSNLDEFLELKVRHYTRNLFLLSEKKL